MGRGETAAYWRRGEGGRSQSSSPAGIEMANLGGDGSADEPSLDGGGGCEGSPDGGGDSPDGGRQGSADGSSCGGSAHSPLKTSDIRKAEPM